MRASILPRRSDFGADMGSSAHLPGAGPTFEPLTPERWGDLTELFGSNGACGGCWCMWWKRSSAEFARRAGASHRRGFKTTVDRGDGPGFLAFEHGQPAASTGASSLWTGLASTFAKAHFVEVERRL